MFTTFNKSIKSMLRGNFFNYNFCCNIIVLNLNPIQVQTSHRLVIDKTRPRQVLQILVSTKCVLIVIKIIVFLSIYQNSVISAKVSALSWLSSIFSDQIKFSYKNAIQRKSLHTGDEKRTNYTCIVQCKLLIVIMVNVISCLV